MTRGLLVGLALLCAACSSPAPPPKPPLFILTALPLFWGEGDVADILQARTGAAPSLVALAENWSVHPLDIANPQALRRVKTLLLAQPPRLSPAELVALDDWVQQGGRLVILADPDLRWPQRWPVGDPRRAPRSTLLSPLYRHWGLDLQPDASGSAPRPAQLGGRRIDLPGSGQWVLQAKTCRLADPALAICPLGQGVAVLVADADFLQPEKTEAGSADAIAALNALLT